MAAVDDLPEGSRIVRSDGTYDLYQAPDGTQYTILRATGEIPRGGEAGPGFQKDLAHKSPVDATTGFIRGTTDDLGITTPDPSGSPEFQAIQEAANAFGGFYGQDRAALDQARALDLDTIARLQAAAEGKVPSAAEQQYRKSLDQAASQGLGLAATLGGSNPGMALRAGLNAQQTAAQAGAADAAMLRAREMEAARALLANQTGRGRAEAATTSSSTGNTFSNIVGAPFGAKERADASNQALKGELVKAWAMSDVSLKKNIEPAPAMADDFLRSLSPQAYEYKRPDVNKPAGRRLGVMAQDLPRNDTMTGPDGKKWISADVIGDVLAGLGRVNQKVEAVSGGAPAGVDPKQYAAAMDYVTQGKPRDVSAAARGAGGMAPNSKPYTDEELGIANQMIPATVVRDFLAGLGMVK